MYTRISILAIAALLFGHPMAAQEAVPVAARQAAPVSDQEAVLEIGAIIGTYLPASEWSFSPQEIEAQTASASQTTSGLLGARVSFWPNARWAVEGQFVYAPSDAAITLNSLNVCSDELQNCSANMWFADLKALYRFLPALGSRWSMHAGGGIALINRSGEAFDDLVGTTNVGGVLDLGGTISVSRRVAIRLDAASYLYGAKFENQDGTALGDRQFQADFLITAGVAIELTRRGEQPDLDGLMPPRR